MTTPRQAGKQFASEQVLVQEGLTKSPQSSDYRNCFSSLMFQSGYQAGRTGLDYDDALTFSLGVLDHVSDQQAEGRRRKAEGRA